MKTLWKILKQRYADMGNLLFAILIVMASVVAYISPTVIRLVLAGGPERMLGGVYACNLFVILVVCVNMLRMDCRKLISNKTAGLLESIGSFMIFFMLIRTYFPREPVI